MPPLSSILGNFFILLHDSVIEFKSTAALHINELFILVTTAIVITYINCKIKQIKDLRTLVEKDIDMLKTMYCVKDIREASIDSIVGDNTRDREYVITLLSDHEFHTKTEIGKQISINNLKSLKKMVILEKDFSSKELISV